MQVRLPGTQVPEQLPFEQPNMHCPADTQWPFVSQLCGTRPLHCLSLGGKQSPHLPAPKQMFGHIASFTQLPCALQF